MKKQIKSYERSIEELSLMMLYLTRWHKNQDIFTYSWANTNYATLETLEKKGWICHWKKSKYVRITKAGKEKAQSLLEEYALSDQEPFESYRFRHATILDAQQIAQLEAMCFPPEQACSLESIQAKLNVASDYFIVAEKKETHQIVGYIGGIATNATKFSDAFFIHAHHDPKGKNIMLIGLAVRPAYRHQRIAYELMMEMLSQMAEKGKYTVYLTCLENKVKFYKKMGFSDLGLSASCWGDTQWHEMRLVFKKGED